jgi:hypothetical protein
MTDFVNSNDDATFDRLVDGELTATERRALLESLDMRPDGWRRCALAFLEAQSWSRDFRELVRKPEEQRRAAATAVNDQIVKRRYPRRAMAWAAIAACLLVAFALGKLQRGKLPQHDGAPLANAPVVIGEPDQPANGSINDPEAVTLWVRDESGRPRSVRVPLLDADEIDRELGVEFRPGMPAHVRSRLQDGGYQVHSKRRYAPLWLENGQRMVLPVEDTKIVPVSENVY